MTGATTRGELSVPQQLGVVTLQMPEIADPPAGDGPPMGIVLEIDTPTDTGAIQITVPLDAEVGETTFRAMASLGVDDPQCYEMWVAVEPTEQGETADDEPDMEWSRLDREEVLLDAMRGAQRRPKIAPAPDNPDHSMTGGAP